MLAQGTGKFNLRTLIALSLFFLFAGMILLYVQVRSRTIESIRITGNHYLQSEEILGLAGIKPGMDASYFTILKARSNLSSHPVIRSSGVELKGSSLIIHVTERSCFAIVKTGEGLFDIDSSLHIISKGSIRCKNVPLISGRFILSGQNEKRLLDAVHDLLRIQELYPDIYLRLSEMRIHTAGLTLFLHSPPVQFELPEKADDIVLKKLYAAYSFLEKSNKGGLIDLRTNDAIVLPET